MGMTKEEFAILTKGLKAIYTSERFIPDQDSFNVWYSLLHDLDYNLAGKAIQKYMMTSSDIPKPADIRKAAFEITNHVADQMTEQEAWALVRQAIRNSSYHSEEEFRALPAIVQRSVGSASQLRAWAIDEEFNDGVASSNFKRVFRSVQERERQDGLLSPNLRLQITEISERLQIGAGMKSGED